MFDLLQSILAFVLTMLGLATLVTVILEMIARFTRRRARVMRHVLEIIFEKEIKPKLEASANDVRAAIDVIISSPIRPDKAGSASGFFRLSASLMNRLFGADQSTDLTARDFLVRLSRTEIGTKLYESAKNEWDGVVEQIETRYDELCAASTEWFRNSTAVGSLIIGVVLAFFLNFDGLRAFEFYLRNPASATGVVAQAEAYIESYNEAQKRLADTIKALEAKPAANAPDPRAEAQESLKQVSATWQAIQAQEHSLTATGLPVGWSFFPFCRGSDGMASPDWRCLPTGRNYFYELVRWLIVVLISGVLIGLGGPFWYNAATGVLRATQILRGKVPPPESAAPGQSPSAAKSHDALKTLFAHRTSEKEDKPSDTKPSATPGADAPAGGPAT